MIMEVPDKVHFSLEGCQEIANGLTIRGKYFGHSHVFSWL